MTKKIRRLFFWIAVIVFFIITPLILSYARGYRFDPERLAITQVGAIFLDSEPDDAIIFLDGEKTTKETPAFLSGLFPFRTYFIRVEKDGFQPWRKGLLVETGGITRAENIILPPRGWERQEYFSTTTPTSLFFVSPKNGQALLWTDTLRVLNIEEKELRLVLFPDRTKTLTIQDTRWSKTEEMAVFKRIVARGSQWHLFDAQSGTAQNLSLVLGQEQEPTQIEFSPDDEILVLVGDKLFLIDRELDEIKDLEINGVQIFTTGDDRIFALTGSNAIVEMTTTGDLIANYGPLEFTPAFLSVSPDNRKIAYLDSNKMGVLWVRDAEKAPFLKTGSQQIILENGESINQFAWHKESNHFFALTEAGEFIFGELDGRGDRNVWRWKMPELESFVYLPDTENLWFLDKDGVLFGYPESF